MELIDRLIEWAVAVIEAGGAWALVLVMIVENLFPPIPSEAVLPLAGYAVYEGRFGLGTALAAATTGSVVGAWILYALGRYGGRPVVDRLRRVPGFRGNEIDRAEAWFERRGGVLVFWARIVPIARSAVSVPAGMSGMPLIKFTLLTTAGSLLWNALLIGAGVLLGSAWEQVMAVADVYGNIMLVVFGILGVVAVVYLVKSARGTVVPPPESSETD